VFFVPRFLCPFSPFQILHKLYCFKAIALHNFNACISLNIVQHIKKSFHMNVVYINKNELTANLTTGVRFMAGKGEVSCPTTRHGGVLVGGRGIAPHS
jgi:hypothetical protein